MKIIVVGAGLAGSAVAHALALRGCDVVVLDAASANAAPTSPSGGLPVGLMAALQSANTPSAQLSQLGTAATLQAARSLLSQGQDWQPCGALQRAGKLSPQDVWMPEAAWIKPAALVRAWLTHASVQARINVRHAAVARLRRAGGAWQALAQGDQCIDEADAIVLANGYAAQGLWADACEVAGDPVTAPTSTALTSARPASGTTVPASTMRPQPTLLHQVAGQVVYGPWNTQWQALWQRLAHDLRPAHQANTATDAAPFALNGNGHFISAVPWHGQDVAMLGSSHIWLSGSTYEHGVTCAAITAQGMASNVQRLQQLIPTAAQLLAQQHTAGQLQAWAGMRCTTRDRLPVVGAAQDSVEGLYLCTGMGSRGLSFAAICGQHIAALITQGNSSVLPMPLQNAIQVLR
jgi:tRNA 5-methylaminomethyl-2-thiouridine biosynthesis bifunctional protein